MFYYKSANNLFLDDELRKQKLKPLIWSQDLYFPLMFVLVLLTILLYVHSKLFDLKAFEASNDCIWPQQELFHLKYFALPFNGAKIEFRSMQCVQSLCNLNLAPHRTADASSIASQCKLNWCWTKIIFTSSSANGYDSKSVGGQCNWSENNSRMSFGSLSKVN